MEDNNNKNRGDYWKTISKLTLESYQVAGGLDPSKWATSQTLQSAAEKLGINEGFLQEIADLYLVPHFRFQDSIRFAMQPLRDWIGENCIQVVNGKLLPEFKIATIEVDHPQRKNLPAELRGVRGITEAKPSCQWPGIYFLTDGNNVVYVGQSKNVATRCGQHTDKVFTNAFAVPCQTKALFKVESEYIKAFLPYYNNCPMAIRAKLKQQDEDKIDGHTNI